MSVSPKTNLGWADSRSKCNVSRWRKPVFHEVKGAVGEEQFGGSFPGQGFSGPGVHPPGDAVQLLLAADAQVGALGQILAQQSIGVFADAAFPRRVRVGKEDRNAGALLQALVMAHKCSTTRSHTAEPGVILASTRGLADRRRARRPAGRER